MNPEWRYCPVCAAPLAARVPAGDDRQRHVCPSCERIHYENPRTVVGSVATWEGRILLCRRAIPPRVGRWTLPAGFLELGESTEEGARREAREEANADVRLGPILALYNLRHISQVQVFYRGRLAAPEVSAGPESQEVGLFAWEELPWDELAFPSVRWALRYHRSVRDVEDFPPDVTPPDAPEQRLQ